MIINIKYNKAINNKLITNYALFSRENYNISNLKSYFSNSEISSIKEIIKNINLKENIISFNLNSKKKIFLIDIKKIEIIMKLKVLVQNSMNLSKIFLLKIYL